VARIEAVQAKGLEKVNADALMIASGQNVKRLVALGPGYPRKIAMVAALRTPETPSPYPIRRHHTSPAWRFSTRWVILRSLGRGFILPLLLFGSMGMLY
jgi:hypothetical protein